MYINELCSNASHSPPRASVSTVVPSLLCNNHKQLPSIGKLSSLCAYCLHHSCGRGGHRALHLHGLQHDQHLGAVGGGAFEEVFITLAPDLFITLAPNMFITLCMAAAGLSISNPHVCTLSNVQQDANQKTTPMRNTITNKQKTTHALHAGVPSKHVWSKNIMIIPHLCPLFPPTPPGRPPPHRRAPLLSPIHWQ